MLRARPGMMKMARTSGADCSNTTTSNEVQVFQENNEGQTVKLMQVHKDLWGAICV